MPASYPRAETDPVASAALAAAVAALTAAIAAKQDAATAATDAELAAARAALEAAIADVQAEVDALEAAGATDAELSAAAAALAAADVVLDTRLDSLEASGVLGRIVQPSGDITGAADVTAIQAALDAAPTVLATQKQVVLHGDYFVNTPIRVPSNCTLTLIDANVKVIDGAHCNAIQNHDMNATGNSNVHVRGIGRANLDANATGNAVLPVVGGKPQMHVGSPLHFVNVTKFSTDGLSFSASRYSSVKLEVCSQGRLTRTHIDQDNSTANQGGFEVAGCTDITIDGVTGTMYDDLLNVHGGGTDSGYWTPYPLTLTAAQRSSSRVVIRNVHAYLWITLRILAGDGSTVSFVSAENINNRNPSGSQAPVLAFGPTNYVTTPPSVGDAISITVDGYSGGAQALVAFDSHADNVQIKRCRITNWGKLVGHVARVSGFSPTINRVSISDIVANGSSGDICALDSVCTVTELEIRDLLLNNCGAILNNACPVSGLKVKNVRINNLTENPFKSTGIETGEVSDVSWRTTSGNYTATLPVSTKLKLGPNFPVLKAADVTPRATFDSRIACNYTKDPTGAGGVTGGVYVGDGVGWVKQADLGGYKPTDAAIPLIFWFEADRITGLANGAAIASVADVAGSGITLAQATSGKRPTWQSSVALLNNKPAMRFDGTDDFLQSAPFTLVAPPLTLFFVYLWRTVPTTGWVAEGTADVAGGKATLYKLAGGETLFAGSNLGDGVPVVNTPYVMAAVFSGTSNLWRNAAAVGSTPVATGSTGSGGINGLTLGAKRDGTSPGAIDLAAIIAYSGVISNADFAAVAAYLGTKYAVTLT